MSHKNEQDAPEWKQLPKDTEAFNIIAEQFVIAFSTSLPHEASRFRGSSIRKGYDKNGIIGAIRALFNQITSDPVVFSKSCYHVEVSSVEELNNHELRKAYDEMSVNIPA